MKHRIVVLGAGYAGTHAAGRLARRLHRDDVEITLVNADPDFVERVRLHQLAVGQELRLRLLRDVFAHTGVVVRTSRVTAVDVDARTVELLDPHGGTDRIGYDTLVYALGSVAPDGVPGVAEHAHSVSSRPAALRLHQRLLDLPAGGTVLVVGGGLTGVEAVTEIAESRPDLHVALAVRGEPGEWLHERARRYLRRTFDRLRIAVHAHTEVTAVDGAGAATGAGGFIPADVVVWAAGFAAHPMAAATTLRLAPTGQIVVDAAMRSVSHPDVHVVGDAAFAIGAGGAPLRMSCSSGIPSAWRAADAVAARLTGRRVPEPLIGYYAQCISLGRRAGIVQHVSPADRARPVVLTGRSAALVKEFICSAAAWSIGHPTLLMPSRRLRIVAAPADRTVPA
ncbi:NAD(P)/FAD-dependent oxidoreductase [Pseudonocardia sp. CA-107938]|uniref:NAD(P)/FAD-dependent oxidoreductase n=1 Tax=Pseudonocardia sp. CA-107938 TaxID=3240021 RepID=UPI003D8ED591